MTFLMHRNRHKEVEKNEDTEEHFPNERTQQNHSKRPKQTERYSMTDREFKVMILKILTGLEERVEDMVRNVKGDSEWKGKNKSKTRRKQKAVKSKNQSRDSQNKGCKIYLCT